MARRTTLRNNALHKALTAGLLKGGQLVRENAFTQIFEATQYDMDGISYRMPDHVRASQSSPW